RTSIPVTVDEHDRGTVVASGAEEVAVDRVRCAFGRDGVRGSAQRLRGNLASVEVRHDPLVGARVRRAVEVGVELFEREQFGERGAGLPLAHACSAGSNSGTKISPCSSNTTRTGIPIVTDSGSQFTMFVMNRSPSCSGSSTIAIT